MVILYDYTYYLMSPLCSLSSFCRCSTVLYISNMYEFHHVSHLPSYMSSSSSTYMILYVFHHFYIYPRFVFHSVLNIFITLSVSSSCVSESFFFWAMFLPPALIECFPVTVTHFLPINGLDSFFWTSCFGTTSVAKKGKRIKPFSAVTGSKNCELACQCHFLGDNSNRAHPSCEHYYIGHAPEWQRE